LTQKGLVSTLEKAVDAIHDAETIHLVAHVNPDGDTIGSILALGLALLRAGKKVSLLSQDGVPPRLHFLPGSELIRTSAKERPDLAIAMDCGSAPQMGALAKHYFKARTTIQVDHHDFGEPFGHIRVLEEEASAVGEIVYEIIRRLRIRITAPIASCLLASIVIDTGSFRFSNVRAKTFEICAALIKTGVDLQSLIEESYWTKTRAMAKLSSHCILNVHFSNDGSIAWSIISQNEIQRYKAQLSDADSVADELRSINGVKIAALFRETENKRYRVSLRSKFGINVALVARRFGGGGHHNSAGCVVRNHAEREKLLRLLENLLS